MVQKRPQELKEDDDAVKTLRKLLARYAEAFPDARAAYALILWDQGDRIEAEAWINLWIDLGNVFTAFVIYIYIYHLFINCSLHSQNRLN